MILPLDELASEVTSEPEAAPAPPPFRHSRSWLVQLRDGRILRVDADQCDATNGVLTFRTDDGNLLAAFEYGDWKRVGIMNRSDGENAAWHVVKERERRR